MSEPIFDPAYWKSRLAMAMDREIAHHAVYEVPLETWAAIRERHRILLAQHVGAYDSVLDAGCGWGRLLSIMPGQWEGNYAGVDVSPDFVAMAKDRQPDRHFAVVDLRLPFQWHVTTSKKQFDWAVCLSLRDMVIRNAGEAAWANIEANLKTAAKRLLILEYDEEDQGEVIVSPCVA